MDHMENIYILRGILLLRGNLGVHVFRNVASSKNYLAGRHLRTWIKIFHVGDTSGLEERL